VTSVHPHDAVEIQSLSTNKIFKVIGWNISKMETLWMSLKKLL